MQLHVPAINPSRVSTTRGTLNLPTPIMEMGPSLFPAVLSYLIQKINLAQQLSPVCTTLMTRLNRRRLSHHNKSCSIRQALGKLICGSPYQLRGVKGWGHGHSETHKCHFPAIVKAAFKIMCVFLLISTVKCPF